MTDDERKRKEQLQRIVATMRRQILQGGRTLRLDDEEWAIVLNVLDQAACDCEPCEACTDDQTEPCFVCGGTRKQHICPICAPGYDNE